MTTAFTGRVYKTLVLLIVVAATTISIGGGSTFLALKATTDPKFCNTCHLMEPYYKSWAESSHNNVTCVDCHFEPGLLETFQGKFEALAMLTKYITSTEGTKPWAEVSDYSCMRSGCHSTRLLQGEIQYGRIRFDHRHHLVGFPKGKKLRCTSCHSQIVQGDHLSVTATSCFLCHFTGDPPVTASGERRINDCNLCHGPPPDKIQLAGGFVFQHSDYLERGVQCDSCHGDVTRGSGEVPRVRCMSCHNVQAHLDYFGDIEFLHKHHVSEHAVACTECHTEIDHGLPTREEHSQADCRDCHRGTHGVASNLYRGTGGEGVEDKPGVMFLARVTCNGCHRPPFEGAPTPVDGANYSADPLACIDCHGPPFEGMARSWQEEFERTTTAVRKQVDDLHGMMEEEWEEEADVSAARSRHDQAAANLSLALLDKSRGVHNLPYVRALLSKAQEDALAGMHALDPGARPKKARIGPLLPSEQGCTTLCHVGLEKAKIARAFDLPFPHARHVSRGKLDCSKCHEAEPHGTVAIDRTNCSACHHRQEEPDRCGACHIEQARLRAAELEDPDSGAMLDLDCLSCHETIAEGHSLDAVKRACVDCHEDEEFATEIFDDWVAEAAAPLEGIEGKEADRLRQAGPFHNAAYVAERARKLK